MDTPTSLVSSRSSSESVATESSVVSESSPEPMPAWADQNGPFEVITHSYYVSIPPIARDYSRQGVTREYLTPMLLTYQPAMKAVVLSFDNIRLQEYPHAEPDDINIDRIENPITARFKNEAASPMIWVTADFTVFSPIQGAWVEGFTINQYEDYISLVCYNLVNVTIERQDLPKTWQWKDLKGASQKDDVKGYFLDENGSRMAGKFRFKIKDYEIVYDGTRRFIQLDGQLSDEVIAAGGGLVKAVPEKSLP
jgi:hypothetical protein